MWIDLDCITMHPALQAVLICAAAAAIKATLAGRRVRARFAELRLPPGSPSLTLWFVIGALYYVIAFILLYRLLAFGMPSPAHRAALILLLALLLMNAAWGFLFFRRKDLRASAIAFLPYGLVAVALALVLADIDRASLVFLAPYLAYLGYAAWWSYRLWVLNRPVSGERPSAN
jgi:tryptophan-rich sensory protein